MTAAVVTYILLLGVKYLAMLQIAKKLIVFVTSYLNQGLLTRIENEMCDDSVTLEVVLR